MKSRLIILYLFSALFGSVFAADLKVQLEQLRSQGYVVTMGELTGAGGRMSLSKLKGFIHAEGVVHKNECAAISVKASSDPGNPKVADITKVQLGMQEFPARDFVGFFSAE